MMQSGEESERASLEARKRLIVLNRKLGEAAAELKELQGDAAIVGLYGAGQAPLEARARDMAPSLTRADLVARPTGDPSPPHPPPRATGPTAN